MKKNRRDLWLQENAVSAATVIETLSRIEQSRSLMPRESDLKELATAYAYLFSSFQQGELPEYNEEVMVH